MEQASPGIDRADAPVRAAGNGSQRYTRRYAADGREVHGATEREQDALTSLLAQYVDALRGAVRSRAELFSLEAQRAAGSATRMAVLAGTLLIVGITAWLLLVTTVVLGLAAAGVPLLLALLVVFAVHIVAAFVTVGRMRKLNQDFQFSATRRSLREGIVKLRPTAEESNVPK